MTFTEWRTKHDKSRNEILDKLVGKTVEEVLNYFDYDNMVKEENNFCELYKTNSKCHDMEDLNCFLCGCPHFIFSESEPLEVKDDIKIMSKCGIDAIKAGTFVGSEGQQCDCTECLVPHRKGFTKLYIERAMNDIQLCNK